MGAPPDSNASKDDVQTATPDPNEVEEYVARVTAPKTKTQRFLTIIWDTFDKDPETRAYINRLDRIFFLYSMYMYFVKYLDQSNVSNAYVSGMQEALNMVGQDRNYMILMYSMGYMTGSGLGMLIMTKIRPSYFLCGCEIVWTICTFAVTGVKTTSQLYGLRFVTGLASAAAFPGVMWVLSSWYSHDELAKRLCLFEFSASIGTMFSGYLQSAVYTNLNGHSGLAGWQWLFIVDGIISVPICFLCVFCIPDAPSNTKARWLKPKHRQFALLRSKAMGRALPKPLTVKRFLSMFWKWQFWCYTFNMLMFTWGFNATSYMNLWLKAIGYSVQDVNNIPTAGSGLMLFTVYVLSLLSDYTGSRVLPLYISAVIGILSMILLSIWNIPKTALMFAFIIAFAADGGTSISITWLQESMQEDHELRGIMLGVTNTISNAFGSWLPLFLFPTQDAPHYQYGYQVTAGFYGIAIVSITVWWYLLRRQVASGKYRINRLGLLEKVQSQSSDDTSTPGVVQETVHPKHESHQA